MTKHFEAPIGDEEVKISRRVFTKAAVGLMASSALAGCGASGETRDGAVTNNTHEGLAVDTVSNSETILPEDATGLGDDVQGKELESEVFEMDLTHPSESYEGRRDPQRTRALREESNPYAALRGEYEIEADELTSPDELPDLWADRWEGWLNAGCTPEEAEEFILLDGSEIDQAVAEQEYLNRMHKKYDATIYKAMTGDDSLKYAMYDILCEARRGVLRRYLRNARRSGNLNETAKVNVLGKELFTSRRDGEENAYMVDIQITNDIGDDKVREIYDIRGTIGVDSELIGNVVKTSIATQSSFDITKPFKELSRLS